MNKFDSDSCFFCVCVVVVFCAYGFFLLLFFLFLSRKIVACLCRPNQTES